MMTATTTITNGGDVIIPSFGVNWVCIIPFRSVLFDSKGVVSVAVALDFGCLWDCRFSGLEGNVFVANNRTSQFSNLDAVVVLATP